MTDATGLPGTPDDEIVSAVLDGEATAAETALVAGDPALTARLEVFRSVSGAVATPVEPPAGARDGAVAAALALHDSLATPGDPDVGDGADHVAPVTPLAPRRSTGRTLSIAAAVVAAIVLPLVALAAFNSDSTNQSDSGQETASDVVTTEQDGSGSAADATSTTLSPSGPTQAEAVGGLDPASDLGAIDDVQTLAAATNTAKTTSGSSARSDAPDESLPATDPQPSTTTAPAAGPETFSAVVGDDPCEIEAQAAEQGLGDLVYTATVTYRGTPAWVHVFRSVDGSFEVAVVSATADCTVLATVRL